MRDVKEYRPIPFWSWNDKLEKDKLIEQIHWMNKTNNGGFFMHARSGLQTEYLSEEWMQCIEICADEAQKLDMKAWLYDENGWPSGFVGGKLLEEEHNRDKYIIAIEGSYEAEATVNYLLTDDALIRVREKKDEDDNYLNLYIHTSVSTADILNPDVVKQFLNLTHNAYQKRFGEKFSEKIHGFFTDEPQYQRVHTPYTDIIADYWNDKYGEDILDELGLLFVEKKGYRSFRYRYWKAMQKLMLESFAKPVYEWCDNHGVKLTGHYIEESTLGYQLTACGGVMPFYEYEHIPGIDWLGKWSEYGLSAKQVGSVAAQLGKKQVLTESFGCCGWDVKPSELRHILGVQYVNGVNLLCQHLIPYSERGTRKYDHPAHYSDVNPWVSEEFRTFNEYFTNLGHLLGEGEQYVNVAVLHPIRSVYFDYKREQERFGYGVSEFDKQFREDIDMLAFHGIEYHFIDETLFEKYGFVENGKLGLGQCVYDYLVLPHIITMDASTEKLINQYVQQGGNVLALGNKPTYLEAESFEYHYLKSNVTLEEIIQAQKYQVSNYQARIYSTYRLFEGKEYLYVVNSSRTQSYTQTYLFGGREFEISLKPGQDMQICLSDERTCKTNSITPYLLRFEHAKVSVRENYLPIDTVQFSTDGKTFSESWPVMALFEKLIRDEFQGRIFLKYEFEVEKLPTEIYLRTEKSNDVAAWFNGTELTQRVDTKEKEVLYYDITSLVQEGKNQYIAQIDWYENPMVKYALFGENVSESLRNCMVYDTELQPIELVGKFGVFARNGYQNDKDTRYVRGEDFYISTLPTVVSAEPTTEGFPFLAGEMVFSQKVTFDTAEICLQIAGEYQTASVKVNGMDAGTLLFDTELDISNFARIGENDIEIRFLLSNKNRMGPHHLEGPKDRYTDPNCFQLFGAWNGRESERYHSYYDIKKFYA